MWSRMAEQQFAGCCRWNAPDGATGRRVPASPDSWSTAAATHVHQLLSLTFLDLLNWAYMHLQIKQLCCWFTIERKKQPPNRAATIRRCHGWRQQHTFLRCVVLWPLYISGRSNRIPAPTCLFVPAVQYWLSTEGGSVAHFCLIFAFEKKKKKEKNGLFSEKAWKVGFYPAAEHVQSNSVKLS